LCVPDNATLKEKIILKAHRSNYSIYLGGTKMYQNLRQHYWWSGMKADIAKHVAKCLTCQLVKAQHCKSGGCLQPLEIPESKGEHITMDFVMSLPRSQRGNDSIWVVVDRPTKSAHFITIRKDLDLDRHAELYVRQIICLHGVPMKISSD